MTYRIYKTCCRIYKFCACKRFWLVYFDYFIYLCQQKVQEEMGGSGSGSGGGGGSSDSDSTPTLTMEQTPLTFEAAEANAKVTFTIKVATDPVEYSRDGKTWSPYTSAEAIELCRQFGCFSQCYTVIEHNLIAEVGQILRWQKFRRY